MKKLYYFLFFSTISNNLFSQPIPTEFKECVSFIYLQKPNGIPIPDGTGFFVGLKDKNDTTRSFIFLVTAKHVIQERDGRYVKSILLRMNTKDSVRYVYVPINTDESKKIYLLAAIVLWIWFVLVSSLKIILSMNLKLFLLNTSFQETNTKKFLKGQKCF